MDRQYEWLNSCKTGAYFAYHASQSATRKVLITTVVQRGGHLSRRPVRVELINRGQILNDCGKNMVHLAYSPKTVKTGTIN